jgi:hypothetical protein
VLIRGDWSFLDSSQESFAFVIRWIIVENGVSSQNNSFDKGSEALVVNVILSNEFLVWLFLLGVSFVSLVVNSAVNGLSVEEHVGDSHSVLSESSCLV